MNSAPLAVHLWSGPDRFSAAALPADRELVVIGVATPDTAIRDIARERIRAALRSVLGALLDRPPEAVHLFSQRGQPLRVDVPGRRIGLSVSHEPGLTLAAIHLHGPVGIDLMRIEQPADWELVARDYLGEQACGRIASMPPAQRARAFALEWTRFESCLKSQGLALDEWNPVLERALMRCRTIQLDLADGLVGTVATLKQSPFHR